MSEQSSPKGRTQIDIFPAIEIENLAALCAGDIKRAIGGPVYPRWRTYPSWQIPRRQLPSLLVSLHRSNALPMRWGRHDSVISHFTVLSGFRKWYFRSKDESTKSWIFFKYLLFFDNLRRISQLDIKEGSFWRKGTRWKLHYYFNAYFSPEKAIFYLEKQI